MDFIETAQYNANGSSSHGTLPDPWRLCRHPNGDFYFYHPEWRLLTIDDIKETLILGYIIDAREDHLQCLEGDGSIDELPADYELVISDVSDTAATIRMYSRSAGAAYTWAEETGLTTKTPEHFWSFVAEYPSHHLNLPPRTEAQFAEALQNAKEAIASGSVFPFTEAQIDQIITRYQNLTALRSEGQNITATLAWLMGAVMPLDAVGRRVDDRNLEAMMNGLHT